MSNCLCKYIIPRQTKNHFCILIHPKEAKEQRTGTGHLTRLSLKNSTMIMGVDFTENNQLNRMLRDPGFIPVLLYPGTKAVTASELNAKAEDKPYCFILIDGTWPWAKKMLKLSKNLHDLPQLSFSRGYRSGFRFKKQPQPNCLSTIETVYYLIKELEENQIEQAVPAMDGFLTVFEKMIDHQYKSEAQAKKLY